MMVCALHGPGNQKKLFTEHHEISHSGPVHRLNTGSSFLIQHIHLTFSSGGTVQIILPAPENFPWTSEQEASIACHSMLCMQWKLLGDNVHWKLPKSLRWAPMREAPSGCMDAFFHWVFSNISTQWKHLECFQWVPVDQRCQLDAGCFWKQSGRESLKRKQNFSSDCHTL
jgi:hypothetical protein